MTIKDTIKPILSALLLATMLPACSTKPKQVTAERALIEPAAIELSGEVILDTYWEQFDKASLVRLAHPTYKITLERPYMSALGIVCRKVLIQSLSQSQQNVACKFHDGTTKTREWRLMPALEDKAIKILL